MNVGLKKWNDMLVDLRNLPDVGKSSESTYAVRKWFVDNPYCTVYKNKKARTSDTQCELCPLCSNKICDRGVNYPPNKGIVIFVMWDFILNGENRKALELGCETFDVMLNSDIVVNPIDFTEVKLG